MASASQQERLSQSETPRLSFGVLGATAERHSAAPAVSFTIAIQREGGGPVRSVLLDVQIQIAARLRAYGRVEQDALIELFGTPERWPQTLRTLLWTRATIVVPPFEQETEIALPIACSYDLQATAPNYLCGLRDGEVPLEFLFSGSVFYASPGGMLQTARISWDCEAAYRLPLRVWREAMDRHFPGSAWLRLDRQAFERLRAYKAKHLCRSFDEAVQRLLEEV